MLTPNNSTSKHVCSFKTFLLNKHVSEKLFLWFWINTRKLEEPTEATSNFPILDHVKGYYWSALNQFTQ